MNYCHLFSPIPRMFLMVLLAVELVLSNSRYAPFSRVWWHGSKATEYTQLTCYVQDLSDKKTCRGSTVLRYAHVFGKSEVSFSILSEVNSKARWNRRRLAGCTPTADQYRKRKLNDLCCQLSISHHGQVFLSCLALAVASGSKSLRKISKLNLIISNNTNNLFLFE